MKNIAELSTALTIARSLELGLEEMKKHVWARQEQGRTDIRTAEWVEAELRVKLTCLREALDRFTQFVEGNVQ